MKWMYKGELGVMTIFHRDGEIALNLSLSIPDAHALAKFIEGEQRNAVLTGKRELLSKIVELGDDLF